MPLGYGIKEESNPGGHLSQTEYDQMMEKKRADREFQAVTCRSCGYSRGHHITSPQINDGTLFCDREGQRTFAPVRPTDDGFPGNDHPDRRHTIPSVTAATSQALLQEILKPKETVDPICRLCGQRKSIHHEGSTTVYDDAKQENVKVDALFCFKNSSLLQQFETLQPPPKDPRLEMEMITRDSLAAKLAQERGLVKSTDPVSVPNLDPEKMREEEPVDPNQFHPLRSDDPVWNKKPPTVITTSGKQAQIVTAIGLAKMVDDLKKENIQLRITKAEVVDKYVETRKREEELEKNNDELRKIAIEHNDAIYDCGYYAGRRSMDKWAVLSFGAGLILGIVGYIFIY